MKRTFLLNVVTVACCLAGTVFAGELLPLNPDRFIHIPGPNPVLVEGKPGAWDDGVIEAADALRDGDTYYFFYHATGGGKSYRLGVATARHPLGPFRKHGTAPVLDLGESGAWDDRMVACAMVLKEGDGNYRMFYSGAGSRDKGGRWHVGLATAAHPSGPWKKCPTNPVLEDFGYVGGVVKVNGKYHLYAEHPIGSTGPDYGPMSLAIADRPTGPWQRWKENPVVHAGKKGEWDDGGFSEAEVFRGGGGFHLFFGGAKLDPERMRTQESIGYAFSPDGFRFSKHPQPAARRESVPNLAAMSEVHAIHEPPFIYLYHTVRYKEPPRPQDRAKHPRVEHLGIEVIATERPFHLTMPVLHRENLGPRELTNPFDCPPLCLANVTRAELCVECRFSDRATKGVRIRVCTSDDGAQWSSADALGLELDAKAGRLARGGRVLEPKPRFAKVVVENLDDKEPVPRVNITADLRGEHGF
ncbi:MAG: hypothetical protein HZA91_10415 [Verrucomicrobia bacterium]|nr:hypothetical protein [Verrucomicrobiota bacterium]